MKYSVFLGAEGVGKSHIITCTAKILANAGKKVLVVDTSKSQNLFFYFNLHKSLIEKGPVEVEGFDLMVNSPYDGEPVYIDLDSVKGNYDYILLEAGKEVNVRVVFGAEHKFLIQDFDHINLIKNKHFVEELYKNKGAFEMHLVFNQSVPSKMKFVYAEKYLALSIGKRMDIPFSLKDFIAEKNNKVDQRVFLKGFSDMHNAALFDIANLITGGEFLPDKKVFKRLIK